MSLNNSALFSSWAAWNVVIANWDTKLSNQQKTNHCNQVWENWASILTRITVIINTEIPLWKLQDCSSAYVNFVSNPTKMNFTELVAANKSINLLRFYGAYLRDGKQNRCPISLVLSGFVSAFVRKYIWRINDLQHTRIFGFDMGLSKELWIGDEMQKTYGIYIFRIDKTDLNLAGRCTDNRRHKFCRAEIVLVFTPRPSQVIITLSRATMNRNGKNSRKWICTARWVVVHTERAKPAIPADNTRKIDSGK